MFFKWIRKFFSAVWTTITWTRKILVNLIFLLVLFIIISAFFTESSSKIEARSVLVLNPSGVLVEETRTPTAADLLLQKMDRTARQNQGETKVQELIQAINLAAQDPKIELMIIDPSELRGCDTTKLMDIGRALHQFKATGKPILAHANLLTQGQYFLASHAHATYLSPLGGIALTGYGLYPTYFKGLLDKTKINFHIFRVGEHKSAVEPFLYESMSQGTRDFNQQWLDSLWETYLSQVADNRDIDLHCLHSYVQNIATNLRTLEGDAATLAKEYKLIDEIKTKEEFNALVAEHLGQDPLNLKKVNFQDYLAAQPAPQALHQETVGIIRGRGPIMPGIQPPNMIGSQSMAKLFQQARADASIVAVVLRLDSPGGSAFASEEIHQEILRTQQAGKPVVVSMGSMAASGAYWIASGANGIVAAPTTLTGSLGIFAALPTFENTAQALGITSDGLGTTDLADLGNPLRPLSATAESALDQLLNFGYQTFVDRIATGRRLAVEDVQKSAQGQVFLGHEAQKLKLVDRLGNIDDAIDLAGNLAGLSVISSKEIQRERSPQEIFMDSFLGAQLSAYWSTNRPQAPLLTFVHQQMNFLASFTDPAHIYARSLECEAINF